MQTTDLYEAIGLAAAGEPTEDPQHYGRRDGVNDEEDGKRDDLAQSAGVLGAVWAQLSEQSV